jgi:hypothetical protein
MNKFKKGEFALLQGQVVEVLKIALKSTWDADYYMYQIKLLNDNLTHWVFESDLVKTPHQRAPKVLFSRK